MSRTTRGAGPDPGPARLCSGQTDPSGQTGRVLAAGGRLWLVRHGETEWSRAFRHTGRTELPLTVRGERQAVGLASALAGLRPALVLSSPRRRALDTARLAGFGTATVDSDLAEWDYGQYEGLTSDQIRRNRSGWTIWSGDPPGGETAREVEVRADRVLTRIRAGLVHGDVLIFGHGHFSRVLAARWLGEPATAGGMFVLGPAAPCVLGTECGVPTVVHWNLVTSPAENSPEPGMTRRTGTP
ncbi:MAG TPA: histidine phosphatase family protein [Mycobacteriales bacterium]|nr:histidine phosphatase family protein [Mycobacteriales bacterium]